MKVLKKDLTINYKVQGTDYGQITIPKGTLTTHQTAMGIDENYNFISDLSWIKKDYPKVASILTHDFTYHNYNVDPSLLEEK